MTLRVEPWKSTILENEDPITDAARRWIIRLASGEMALVEHQRFAAWLSQDPRHAEAFEAENRLWQLAGSLGPGLLGKGQSETIDREDRRPHASPSLPAGEDFHIPEKAGVLQSRPARIAAAAFAVIALAIFAFADELILMTQADVSTSAGYQRRYELPDGSVALLNTASALAVDYSARERRVRLLKGEAFFEVRRQADLPFRVQANGGIAEAVGTAFAVRRTNGTVTVTVAEGKVAVYLPRHDRASSEPAPVVEANRKLEFNEESKSARSQNVDVEKSLAWRGGKIVFEGTPFSNAIAELDRYFPGRIVIAGDVGKAPLVTGVVHSDQLIAGIRAIAAVQGLSVTEVPGELLLVLH